MKILVICQYYYPEPFRVSDYCEELVKIGHEVTVLTGTPNYPEGNIYDNYKGKYMNGHSDEFINGVRVKRCKIIPRKTGVIYRFLNYYSYVISANKKIKELDSDYDVVLVNQLSPVMMALPGIKYKKKHKKKLVLYCLDLWPESLCTGGVKRNGAIYNVFHYISKQIYQKCDLILVTSKGFRKYFEQEFKIHSDKIEYLPQYAENIFESNKNEQVLNQEKEWCDLVFAGNIGVAQSVQTIIYAAKELENQKIKFHIVGDGSEYKNCISLAKKLGLRNVIFYGRKPLEEMPVFYEMADAMLVTLMKDDVLSMTLPGKIQTYMLSSKVIIGAIDGEAREVINEAKCGFCGEAENTEQLIMNIKTFLEIKDKRPYIDNSKIYYMKNYSKNIFLNNVIKILQSVTFVRK